MARQAKSIPWLTVHKNGKYYVNWNVPGQRYPERCSLGTRDADEAKARYAAFLSEGGAKAARGPAPLTVREVLAFYEKEHVGPKVVDKVRARGCISNLNEFFGDKPITEINIAASHDYVKARQTGLIGGKGRWGDQVMAGTAATARRELGLLIAAVNHCIKRDHLSSEDFRRDMKGRVVLVELPPDSEPVRRWLTRAELEALRTACGPTGQLRWFVELCYYTGSRREAIERLTWFQVDLERNRIYLAKPGEPKTNKRRPIIPIDPMLRPWLDQMAAARTGPLVLTGAQMYRPFIDACKRAGGSLAVGVWPHILRHTRATHLLQEGKSLFAVANLLGDTVATVERVYGSHSADFMAEVLSQKT